MVNIMGPFKRLAKGDFAKDVFFTAGGQLAVLVLALIVNKLMSIYLAPEEFTIFSIANKGASVIAFIMLLGLGIAVPRYIARIRAKANRDDEVSFIYAASVIFLVSSTITGIVLVLFQNYFASVIFNSDAHNQLIVPMVLFAFGIAVSGFLYAYLRGVDKFKEYSGAQILTSVIAIVIVIICGANIAEQLLYRGAIISLLSLVAIIAIGYTVYKFKKPVRAGIKKHTVSLLVYCLPRVPGEFFLFAYTVAPLVVINTRFGSESAAAFAVAITLNLAITPLFQLVGTVLLPYVSKNLAKGKSADITDKINKLRLMYIGIGLLSMLPVYIFTEVVIGLLFSPEYVVYADTVRIMYLSVIPYAIYLLLRNPIDAASKIPFNTINLAISLGVLMIVVLYSPSLLICSVAFPISYLILSLLSELTWKLQIKSELKKHPIGGDIL